MVVVRVLVDVVDVDDVLAGGGAPVELDLPSRGENRIQIKYKKRIFYGKSNSKQQQKFNFPLLPFMRCNVTFPLLPSRDRITMKFHLDASSPKRTRESLFGGRLLHHQKFPRLIKEGDTDPRERERGKRAKRGKRKITQAMRFCTKREGEMIRWPQYPVVSMHISRHCFRFCTGTIKNGAPNYRG